MSTTNTNRTTGTRARLRRLLLVDDEPMLQFTLKLMLEEFFDVVVASSGNEGRALIEAAPDFDVVLSDLQMPGGSGQQLHAWVAEAHPKLAGHFVFMTGGACTDSAIRFLSRPDVVSIEKPFDFDTLVSVVQQSAASESPQAASA